MYLEEREQYHTEILTREEYRKFGEYMTTHYPSVGHVVEKLDETFVVKIDDNPLTFWEEILLTVREN
jgi:hypothetical protein|tara:strand:- start:1329 stop:1529 length:201 start_codon:yes stop_codon:yes gene_type:complete